jgi:hypothetical protein
VLVIQLGTWASGSNVLSEKLDLVSNLEVWMVLASEVYLLLLPFLCHLEFCHKVLLNMSKLRGPFFNRGVYKIPMNFKAKLGMKTLIDKEWTDPG